MTIDVACAIIFFFGFWHGYSRGIIHTIFNLLTWMFGLTPEDVESRRPLPAPVPASRGVDHDGDGWSDDRRPPAGLVTPVAEEIDWSDGFDEDDLRAA